MQLPQLYFKITAEDSLSEIIQTLKAAPLKVELFLEIEGRFPFFHRVNGVKEMINELSPRSFQVKTTDQIAKKLLVTLGVPIWKELPKTCQDFYSEIFPQQKFVRNFVGKAYEAQESEIIKIIHHNKNENLPKFQKTLESISLRKKLLISTIAFLSFGIISFLISIVLPTATVYLIAQKKSIDTTININFIKTDKDFNSESENYGNNFQLFPLELNFKHEIKFPVLSKVFEGQNASGWVKIVNNYQEEIALKKGSRITNADGLVFLTNNYIKIPPASIGKGEKGERKLFPGEAKVRVSADNLDLYQEIIGSRGNIPPQKFKIPGLTDYLQKQIWAESTQNFSEGTTRWRKEVKESDLKIAEDKIQAEMMEKSRQKIQELIVQKNQESQKNIMLFPVEKYFQKKLINLTFPPHILGQSVEEFPVQGEFQLKAFVFQADDLQKFISDHLEQKRDPNMKVEKIDFNNMTFQPFQETPREIRVAISVKGRQSFRIIDTSTETQEFQTRIKNEIRGLTKDQAIKYLFNQPEINQARINIWPPLKQRLPLLKDSISIKEEN